MSDVSCRVSRGILDAIRERDLPEEALVAGLPITPAELRDVGNRISWELLAELLERAEKLCGGLEALEEIASRHYQLPYFEYFNKVARLFLSARDLYWMGVVWYGPTLFSMIDDRFEELPNGQIRTTLEIPPGYRDSPQFFHLMLGAIRSGPRLLGQGNALVEMRRSPRRAVYDITPPPPLTIWARLRRAARVVFAARGVVEELSAQQVELKKRYEEVRAANAIVAAQAEALEHQVRERTAELVSANKQLREQIRQRERDAQALKQSQEQLLASERLASTGTLAAGIAHEINNPVGSILACAQYALASQNDPKGPEIMRRQLEKIVLDSRRCGRIVKSVLQFACNEPTEKWMEDLNEVVRRAVALTRNFAAEHSALISLDLSEEPLPTIMNPIQMEQVVVNLLCNAIEAGSRRPHATVRTRLVRNKLHLSVSDDGCGIGPEDLSRVFDPFFSKRRGEGGTGLGLSVVHGIIREHYGKIKVESSPDVGTTITITLPVREANKDAEGGHDEGSDR